MARPAARQSVTTFAVFLKRQLRPVKHALLRLVTRVRLDLRRYFNRDKHPVRRVETNTHSYLVRSLAASELPRAYIPIDTALPFSPPPGKTLGSSQLTTPTDSAYRQGFVACLENARVLGDLGHVVTGDGTLLADVSFLHPDTFYRDRDWGAVLDKYEPAQLLSGTSCVLASHWAGDNYFHFLFELLPRCEMVRRGGIALDTIDHLLVNHFKFGVFWEGLSAIGISAERARHCGPRTAFQCARLIAPSTLFATGHKRRWVCEWLRQTFRPEGTQDNAPLRLYVGRDDAPRRHLTNQDELLDRILLPLGFEPVNCGGRSIREQAALFANADVVVALNGAALANLVFCKPGTRVIVLQSPGYHSRYTYELCYTLKLDYYYLVGESMTPGAQDDYATDYFTRPEALGALLQMANVTNS